MKTISILVASVMLFAMSASAQTRRNVRTTKKATTTTTKKATTPKVIENPKLVDLGLPSGTKWADRNVGASSVTSSGDYYAYGETTTKQTYSEDNYTFDSDLTDIAGTEYDVATKKYGEGWAIPTKEQWQELFDNCERTYTYVNQRFVVKFTAENGNSICFPFASNTLMKAGTPEQSKQVNQEVLGSLQDGLAQGKSYGVTGSVSACMLATSDKEEAFLVGANLTINSSNRTYRQMIDMLNEKYRDVAIKERDATMLTWGVNVRPVFNDATNEDETSEDDSADETNEDDSEDATQSEE